MNPPFHKSPDWDANELMEFLNAIQACYSGDDIRRDMLEGVCREIARLPNAIACANSPDAREAVTEVALRVIVPAIAMLLLSAEENELEQLVGCVLLDWMSRAIYSLVLVHLE